MCLSCSLSKHNSTTEGPLYFGEGIVKNNHCRIKHLRFLIFYRRNQGIAYLRQKQQYQNAIASFQTALRINPQYAEAYLNQGVARRSQGDLKRSIVDFNQAVRINPRYAEAYQLRATTREFLGDKKGTRADLQIAAELFLQQNKIQSYQQALKAIDQITIVLLDKPYF